MNLNPDPTKTNETQYSDANKHITTHDSGASFTEANRSIANSLSALDPTPLQGDEPNRIKYCSLKRDKRKIFVGGLPLDCKLSSFLFDLIMENSVCTMNGILLMFIKQQ